MKVLNGMNLKRGKKMKKIIKISLEQIYSALINQTDFTDEDNIASICRNMESVEFDKKNIIEEEVEEYNIDFCGDGK